MVPNPDDSTFPDVPVTEPDFLLRIRGKIESQGMDQTQFYIFMKDVGEAPWARDKTQTYSIF